MLVLRRRDGEWTEIVHRSGDVLRIRNLGPGKTDLAFDDPDRNFRVERPERTKAREPAK